MTILILALLGLFIVIKLNKIMKNQKKLELEIDKLKEKISRISYENLNEIMEEKNISEININENSNNYEKEKIKTKVKAKTKVKIKKNIFKNINKDLFSVESIITKLGVLLLLIGIGFIFKLAYDNGYVTEELAILFGTLFGISLTVIGGLIRKKNQMILSQVLFGAGTATLFITTYAAYQGYGIISAMVAFAYMILIAISAFSLAMYINSVSMSVIAVIGGLLTPFIVELDFLGLDGLGLYIVVLALAGILVYSSTKWKALQLSTIIGVSLVTTYLISLGNFTVSETYKLSILIVVLLVIFNGMEYYLYYKEKNYKITVINLLLFGILPLFTLIQTNIILDISSKSWSKIYLVVAIIYLLINRVLTTKDKKGIITNITLSFVGLFSVFSMLLYFEGNLQYMSIILISLMFYYAAKKSDVKFIYIIARIIYLFGFMLISSDLINNFLFSEYLFMDVVSKLLVIVLLTIGILMERKVMRYIYGVLVYEIYILGFFITIIWKIENLKEPLSILMIILSVWIWVLYYLSKEKKIVPKKSLLAVALIPVIIKSLISINTVYIWEYNLTEIFTMLIYCGSIYTLANYKFKEDVKERSIYKIYSLLIIAITCIVDLFVITDHFTYGLLLFGIIIQIIMKFESDRKEQLIVVVMNIMKVIWGVLFIQNIALGMDYNSFLILPFISDLGLLLIVAIMIKDINIKQSYKYIVNLIFYMVIIFMNFQPIENGEGTTTLLWALYVLISLAYSVYTVKREIVNISLAFIVFIALKFVIVDISAISIVWRIITSMGLGIALLLLQYILNPILLKNEADDNVKKI